MILRKTFRFEASHILPKHPGKCSRLHGHSWVLHVFVEGPVNPKTGFVMDYADMSKVVSPLIEGLDHRHLGAFPFDTLRNWAPHITDYPTDIYPSSEILLSWIGSYLLKVGAPDGGMFSWSALALEETCTSYAYLARRDFDTNRGGIIANADKK